MFAKKTKLLPNTHFYQMGKMGLLLNKSSIFSDAMAKSTRVFEDNL